MATPQEQTRTYLINGIKGNLSKISRNVNESIDRIRESASDALIYFSKRLDNLQNYIHVIEGALEGLIEISRRSETRNLINQIKEIKRQIESMRSYERGGKRKSNDVMLEELETLGHKVASCLFLMERHENDI